MWSSTYSVKTDLKSFVALEGAFKLKIKFCDIFLAFAWRINI